MDFAINKTDMKKTKLPAFDLENPIGFLKKMAKAQATNMSIENCEEMMERIFLQGIYAVIWTIC